MRKILVKDFHLFTNRNKMDAYHSTLSKTMFFLMDDEWKRVRSIATPTFTSAKLKRGLHLIKGCVEGVLENLETASDNQEDLDLKKLYGAYTLDVIAKAAFAADIDTHKDPNNLFAKNVDAFFTISYWRTLVTILLPTIASYFNVTFTKPGSFNFFESAVAKIIKERREHPGKYDDLLQLLMDAEYDEGAKQSLIMRLDSQEGHDVVETPGEEKTWRGLKISEKKLTESEISAQCFIFFIAGYETTATLLTYASYSMALNQDIQEKLYGEIMDAFVGPDQEVDYDTLLKLPYLDAILSETLRLYSPLFRLDRTCAADFKCEDTGVQITAGTRISIPIHVVHRDPQFYPEPEKFDPTRFLPENKSKLTPYTYLPFGFGPRNCIGMRFALLEAKLAVVEMVRRYRFIKVENTDVPLQFPKFMALFHAKRVIVGVEKR